MQLAGAGSVPPSTATAAASAAKPVASASAVISSSTTLSHPSAARYISHSTAILAPQTSSAAAATAAGTTSQSINSSTAARPWLLRYQSAAPPPPAAVGEDALAASLRSAAASSRSATPAAAAAVTKRPGFIATAGIIFRQDGVSGFTRGIQASAARAICNGGIRLGLYDPIKTLMSHDGTGRDLHVGQKLAAGSISGGIGAVMTTPIELCKTRLQVCLVTGSERTLLLCQVTCISKATDNVSHLRTSCCVASRMSAFYANTAAAAAAAFVVWLWMHVIVSRQEIKECNASRSKL